MMRAWFRLTTALLLLLLIWCECTTGRNINGLAKLHRSRLVVELHPPGASGGELGPTVKLSACSVVASPTEVDAPSMFKINTLMLLFYSTLGSVMPYFPLYYRKLGITDSQIGILGAITPAITFIVSPLWGVLADSTGQHKRIMVLTFVGSVLARSLMGLVDNNVVLLGIVVAISAVLFAPVKPLLDSAVLAMLADKSMYGKSRLFGQVGFGIGSFLVGPLLGAHLRWTFLVQALLALPTTYIMSTIPAAVKTDTMATPVQEKARMQKLSLLLRDPIVVCFFAAIFIIGLSSGIIENFAYVKIAEVSGTGTRALSISRLVSSLAGGPMFWLSGHIIKRIGTKAVLMLSLLSYVVRFAIYASITRGWHAIPAEILRGVTFALFWSAATTYVYRISPQGLSATMLGLLNGIYGGLGQSIGSLIGGELVRTGGISSAFYKCAAVDGVLLAGFMLYMAATKVSAARAQKSNSALTVVGGDR